MYLRELRIDDFGCFRNARLDTLDRGLVVIGGPQRAGKTTFMQALRQFPAGIGRSDDLPPATDEYRIDAELTHDGHRYRYVLAGHAKPSVSPVGDGPAIEAADIFGPITERQYRNLYTISLDELRRLPPGIDDSEDLARVLLGGAYGDIAEIPEIEESFRDRAYDIGLSRGDPSTKSSELNDPYRTIQAGVKARTEASQQVDEYRSVTQKLEDTRSEQAEIEAEIAHRRQRRDRLNVLTELFDPLQQLETVSAHLDDVELDEIADFPTHLTDRLDLFEEQFETVCEELAAARQEFDQEAAIERTDDYDEWLLDHEAEIESLTEDQKLLAKSAEDLLDRESELESKRQEIEREISSLYSEWGESFTHIDQIETSTLDTARVSELVSTIDDLQTKRNELETSIDTATTRKTELEAELEDMEEKDGGTRKITVSKRKPAIVAGTALAVGTGVGFAFTPVLGGIVGLAVLAVGFYAIDSTVTVERTVAADPYREIKGQVTTLEGEIRADSKRLADLENQIEQAESEFTDVVTALGIPGELPTSEIPAFYEKVVEVDDEIETYREKQREWERERTKFVTDLEAFTTLLEDVTDVPWKPAEPLVDADKVLTKFEGVVADLGLARTVRRAKRERTACIEDIDSVLSEWDGGRSIDPATEDEEILQQIEAFDKEAERISKLRETVVKRDQLESQVRSRLENDSVRAAFEPLREGDEPWIDVVRNVASQYADEDAITDEIRDQKGQITELIEEREELRERCIELEKKQEELASEEDLRKSRATIEEGRVEFERLGEAYAVNRIAETMVNQLHERLMEDVVHSLVDDASDIFSEITQEYDGIELDGTVRDLDFRALREGNPDHGIGELSRATAEQLFLSVRLARIRQTDLSVPVVLDDAATNFDPDHLSRVFEVIDQLTASNQVFFLTCHPQFVRITKWKGMTAQYWSLEDGQFSRRETADALEQHLSVE